MAVNLSVDDELAVGIRRKPYHLLALDILCNIAVSAGNIIVCAAYVQLCNAVFACNKADIDARYSVV